MQFRKGDKVRFLNETGEGTVTKIVGNGMAMVEIEGGFEYPYPLNQLVPAAPIEKGARDEGDEGRRDGGRGNGERGKKETAGEKYLTAPSGFNERVADGIYLAFIPRHQAFPSAGEIDLVFYNHTDYDIFYTLSLKDGREWTCIQSGALGPRRHAEVETLTPQQIDEWGTVKTDLLFFSDESYVHRAPISDQLKLKGVKFFKDATYTADLLTGKRAYVAEIEILQDELPGETERPFISNDDIRRMLEAKEKQLTGKKTSVPARKNQELHKEIDLHIEELMDNWSGLGNAQLMDVQLKKVMEELDAAIAARMQRIVFIHGVGNGRLKQEVRRILSTYKGIRFHDASYQRYGFGATEVELFG